MPSCSSPPSRIFAAAIILLFAVALPTLEARNVTSCRAANLLDMPFCGNYVTWPIASDWNETIMDANALNQHLLSCPYYAYQAYACSKFFPRCINATATTPAHDTGICQNYCWGGADNTECSNIFADSYFLTECNLPLYFQPPECISDGLAPSSSSNTLYVKLGLGLGLGLGALLLAFLLWRQHRSENLSEKELDEKDRRKAAKARIDKEKQAKKQEAEDEKARKKRSKHSDKAKKYREPQMQQAIEGAGGADLNSRPEGAFSRDEQVHPDEMGFDFEEQKDGNEGGGILGLQEIELQPPGGVASVTLTPARPLTHGASQSTSNSSIYMSPPQPSTQFHSSSTPATALSSEKKKKHKKKTKEDREVNRETISAQRPVSHLNDNNEVVLHMNETDFK